MQITTPELPKGIKRVMAKGKPYYYHRKTNTRINAPLGTQAFADALAELEEGITRARINRAAGVTEASPSAMLALVAPIHPEARRRNSIWLQIMAHLEKAPEFRGLSTTWQRDLRRWANTAADRWPEMTAEQAASDNLYALIEEWRVEIFDTGKAATADRMPAALRRLTAYGRKVRILTRNALLEKFEPLRAVGGRVELVFKLEWFTPKALKALGDGDITDAMELALWTGARRSDLCKLTWDMLDKDGWLTFDQGKVKKEINRTVSLPTFALPPLAALLKRIKAKQKALGYTGPNILTVTDPTGQRGTRWMRFANLDKRWRAIKEDAHNKHLHPLHWHDLRGTLATAMDEAGCSDKEIAAVTGHAVRGEVPSLAKYRKISRENALRAYTKLAAFAAKKLSA